MIQDVDVALQSLVRREVLDGSGVEISLEAPTKDWGGRRTAPTVDLYLYDIREDVDRRHTQWVEVRDETGAVVRREQPPRRFRLSYLVTAWTQRPEDEHRLLASCLATFLRHEVMPPELVGGALIASGLPVIMEVALPRDTSKPDVWSALGGELKPSLDLTVIAPFPVGVAMDAAPPVQVPPTIDVTGEQAERRSSNERLATGAR